MKKILKLLLISGCLIWLCSFSFNQDQNSIHYSELEQIINHMNSMDSCGYVKKIEIEKRIRETMKYYKLKRIR